MGADFNNSASCQAKYDEKLDFDTRIQIEFNHDKVSSDLVSNEGIKTKKEQPIEQGFEDKKKQKGTTNVLKKFFEDANRVARNLTISRKLVAALTAGAIAFTLSCGFNKKQEPSPSDVKTNTTTQEEYQSDFSIDLPFFVSHSDTDYVSSSSSNKLTYDISFDQYKNSVENAYRSISQQFDYDNLIPEIQSAIYLVNYEYMGEQLEKDLASSKIIYEGRIIDDKGNVSVNNAIGWKNIENYTNLISAINAYNQVTIQESYRKNGKVNIDSLIDPSVLCIDEYDRICTHQLFEGLINAYNLAPYSIVTNDSFINTSDQLSNLGDISVGARWNVLNTIGNSLLQFERDYMFKNFSMEELEKYFKSEKLKDNQLEIRADYKNTKIDKTNIEAALRLLTLQQLANYYNEGYDLCSKTVNKDLFNLIRLRNIDQYEPGFVPIKSS